MNTNTKVKENKNYVQIIYKFNIIKDLGGKSVVFGTSRVDVPVLPPPQVGRKNKREAQEGDDGNERRVRAGSDGKEKEGKGEIPVSKTAKHSKM